MTFTIFFLKTVLTKKEELNKLLFSLALYAFFALNCIISVFASPTNCFPSAGESISLLVNV